MRKVLVVSSSEWPMSALRAALGDADELRVVVPAVHQSRLQWLTNADDHARGEPTRRHPRLLRRCLRRRRMHLPAIPIRSLPWKMRFVSFPQMR